MSHANGKQQLTPMLPGTFHHYFKDEPEHLAAPAAKPPSLVARLFGALAIWVERRAETEELSALSDQQLADIGLSRAEVYQVFDPDFAADRSRDKLIARVQTGRVATI